MAQNITNNLNLWDSNKTNYSTSAQLKNDTQRQAGFQANEYLKSATFNGLLMELSLVTVSLIDALSAVSTSATSTVTVQNGMTQGDLVSAIKNILEGLSVNYATSAGSTPSATRATNLAGGAKGRIAYQTGANATGFIVGAEAAGYILSYGASDNPEWVNPANLSVSHASTADSATIATNVGDITNDDNGANTTIAFSIGSGTNKKSFSKTISVQVPGTVTNAETVTDNIKINGTNKAISSIFENSGAAKNATYAEEADHATSANTSDYANDAGSAGYATSAGSAGNASTADTATNISGGGVGSLPYQTTASQTGMLSIKSSSYLLQGGSSPTWEKKSDIRVGEAARADYADSADYANTAGSASLATSASKISDYYFSMSYDSTSHVLTIVYHQ